jgi:RNA polymerase sigma-70 factor (ECF subfamily)
VNFVQLYRDYTPRVTRFFLRKGVPEDRAEELTQEVFIRVYGGMERFRHESRVGTWIFTIARNLWLNEIRARNTDKRQGTEVPVDDQIDAVSSERINPEAEMLLEERHRILHQALEELPNRMRWAVELRLERDFKYREIARIMGVSVQTIKSQLFQARQRLREVLGDTYGERDTARLEAADCDGGKE